MSDPQIDLPAFLRLQIGVAIGVAALFCFGCPTGLYVTFAALAIAMVVAWAAGAIAFGRRLRRWEAHAAGRCAHCGYDLRATPARCPECGRPPGDTTKLPGDT